MRRTLPLAIAISAIACLNRPITAPAPLTFRSAQSARDAARSAAVALVNAGFRVTQSDTVGFALEASRTATHNGNAEFVTCSLPAGSAAAANRETTLTISFRAIPADSGSNVTLQSRVQTAYPGYGGTAMQVPLGDSACVSNGTMERRLQEALR